MEDLRLVRMINYISVQQNVYLYVYNFYTCMQVFKKRSKHRKLRQKMQMMKPEIDFWVSKNALPKNLKTVIVENVQRKLEKNNIVDRDNFLHNLPVKDRRDVMSYLGMTSLKKVSMFSYNHLCFIRI